MSMLMRPAGTYQEERLYVLGNLERLESQWSGLEANQTVLHDRMVKASLDLNAAHTRIRELAAENAKLARHVLKLELRAGAIAAGAGVVIGALGELARWFLHWGK